MMESFHRRAARSPLFLALLALLCSGCWSAYVRGMAAEDLRCKEDLVTVEESPRTALRQNGFGVEIEVPEWAYIATGCNRQLWYQCFKKAHPDDRRPAPLPWQGNYPHCDPVFPSEGPPAAAPPSEVPQL